MKKYLRHMICAMEETVAYRLTYLINILSSFVFYLAIFFIWKAIYQNGSPASLGVSLGELKTYMLIALVMNSLVSYASEFRISGQIRMGNIATDLIHPVDFLKAHFFITLGCSIMEGVIVMVFAVVFGLCIGDIALPASPVYLGLFVLSIAFSFVLKFLIVYIFALFSFWTTSMMGVVWLRRAVTEFFSGAIVPVMFFPDWLQKVSHFLPFEGIIHVPAYVFLGKFSYLGALQMLGVQLLWIGVLWAISQAIWRLALRKVTILGG